MKGKMLLQMDYFRRMSRARSSYYEHPKEDITAIYVEVRLEALESLWSSFESSHRTIVEQYGELLKDHVYFRDNIYSQTFKYYIEFKTELTSVLNYFNQSTHGVGSFNEFVYENVEERLSFVQNDMRSVSNLNINHGGNSCHGYSEDISSHRRQNKLNHPLDAAIAETICVRVGPECRAAVPNKPKQASCSTREKLKQVLPASVPVKIKSNNQKDSVKEDRSPPVQVGKGVRVESSTSNHTCFSTDSSLDQVLQSTELVKTSSENKIQEVCGDVTSNKSWFSTRVEFNQVLPPRARVKIKSKAVVVEDMAKDVTYNAPKQAVRDAGVGSSAFNNICFSTCSHLNQVLQPTELVKIPSENKIEEGWKAVTSNKSGFSTRVEFNQVLPPRERVKIKSKTTVKENIAKDVTFNSPKRAVSNARVENTASNHTCFSSNSVSNQVLLAATLDKIVTESNEKQTRTGAFVNGSNRAIWNPGPNGLVKHIVPRFPTKVVVNVILPVALVKISSKNCSGFKDLPIDQDSERNFITDSRNQKLEANKITPICITFGKFPMTRGKVKFKYRVNSSNSVGSLNDYVLSTITTCFFSVTVDDMDWSEQGRMVLIDLTFHLIYKTKLFRRLLLGKVNRSNNI